MTTLNDKQKESLNRHLIEAARGSYYKGPNLNIYKDKSTSEYVEMQHPYRNPPDNIEQAMGCFGKIRSGYIVFDERLLYKCNKE